MSAEVAIYVSALLAMTGILGIFAMMIYRKHKKQFKMNLSHILDTQERRQQAIDLNLPPFYIDHIRDPIVHDHEPTLETVMVQVPNNGQLYSPTTLQTEPVITSSNTPPQSGTIIDFESNSNGRQSILPPLVTPRIVTTSLSASTMSSAAITAGSSTGSLMATIPTPTPTPSSGSDSDFGGAAVLAPEMVDLSDLPPPPSYDVPNVVVERSPILVPSLHSSPSSTGVPTLALGSNASALSLSLSPSLTATSATFVSTTVRNEEGDEGLPSTSISGTIHTIGNQHQLYRQISDGAGSRSSSETPRYSAEFDSNVPHEVRLQEYRRARAMSDTS
ncbi:hypothetical protein BG004_002424, partial [Podila humilis]